VQNGGFLDKFIGDGVMAAFGLSQQGNPARDAIAAAAQIARHVDRLNAFLQPDLDAPLKFGIGLHWGPAIVGKMGYRSSRQLTLIGDTVNTASRLEGHSKELGCQLVMSEEVAMAARIAPSGLPPVRELEIRGRSAPVRVHAVSDVRSLEKLAH
jgi:adenylate cyclase